MNLFRRLFSSKPAKKPARVPEQIVSLDQQSPEQLLTIARTHAQENLRDAAINRLPYSAELIQLALQQPAKTQVAARKRLGTLLQEGSTSLAQVQADAPHADDVIALLSYAPAQQQAYLDTVTDNATLLKLASDGATSQLRQAAAAKLESRSDLEQLCKRVQSKDKNVFKLAKARLDVFKAEDARVAVVHTQINTLCEKLEKLSRQEADSLYKARVELLETEWNTITAEASAELAARYQQALQACQAQIDKRAGVIAQEEEKIALDQQAAEFSRTAESEARALITELEEAAELSEANASEYRQKLNDLQQAARLIASRTGAAVDSASAQERIRQYALALIEQFSQHGTFKALTATISSAGDDASAEARKALTALVGTAQEFHRNALPETVKAASEILAGWRQREAQVQREAKDAVRNLEDLIRKGLRAAEQGMVRKARGIHKEVQEKTAALSGIPTAINNKREELDQAIARLADWHEFAVTPKKEALITQMQALAASTIAPDALATRIHDLQDEWRSLSKGVQQHDEALWEQFQQASQIAFAPCKEYFDNQTREREANLEKRRDLVAHMQTYLDQYQWDNAVWKDVEQTLKVARQEWQNYWPVPRKAAEALQAQFDGLMDQVYGKLKAFYQSNKAAKQTLIAEAEALSQHDNLTAAIEGIKQLQARWKTVGKSYPKEDQNLWHDFRKHCDAVFAKRASEFNAQNSQRQQQADAATTLIAELNVLADQSGEVLRDASDAINALKDAFRALNDLPRDQQKSLQQQFQTALSRITDTLRNERSQAEIRSWQDLFALANDLRSYETGSLSGQKDAALEQALTDTFAAAPILPAGALPVLQARFNKVSELDAALQQQNTEQLSVVTIRAEIAADLPSPDADKSRRMEYQIKQLQQGFGQREESLEALVYEWVALSGVAEEDYQPLFLRFMACLAKGDAAGQRG